VQIDYFTIFAQIINFLILVFLLRHFLYRPVTKLMEEREQKIVSRLRDVEKKKKEAEQELESSRKMLQDLSSKREVMMSSAAQDAQLLGADLMKKAREEVSASSANWYRDLQAQEATLLEDLNRRAGAEIYAIARRALQDLANEDLERQIINHFIERLQNMDKSESEMILEFYKSIDQEITVRSTFVISEEMRRKIQETVRNQTGIEAIMQYEIAPELICGVEMDSHGIRVSWSIAGYLNTLQADLSEVLAPKTPDSQQRVP
jgi:F-type H+-transporting ATPase subunit b